MGEQLFEVERAAAAGEAGTATVVLRCHLQPGAGRAAVAGRHGDALHLRVAPPPVDGRANRALLELVAALLDVRAGQVTLAGGERSRDKRVRVEGVVPANVTRVLDEAIARAGERVSRRAGGGRRGR